MAYLFSERGFHMIKPAVAALGVTLALAACQDTGSSGRSRAPIPSSTLALMESKGMNAGSPILIRSYKKEAEMEVWKRGSDGRYALLKTYAICRWSGQLGPKVREGDRQAPEGFYPVSQSQMNPNSAYYLSFDTGYPNAYDRAKGRSGSALMVHGSCSSRGCFAMTDASIAEIYAVAREALNGGQRSFQFQSYPFRMTPKNMAAFRADPNIGFWRNLKEGSDYFEVTHEEPRVAVCGGKYTFNATGSCTAPLEAAVIQKTAEDARETASLVANGTKAISLVYADGGQHSSFQGIFSSDSGNNVSRPDALAATPREIAVSDANPETTSSIRSPATLNLAPLRKNTTSFKATQPSADFANSGSVMMPSVQSPTKDLFSNASGGG